ncbi:AAA family ATPase [Streptomyces hesseae]|uniref:AAA family ATPase n=1 Tax=Streptomyces hesseae TaxID=3075519 RepID=A0ABU2SFI7_9ACTN|nr:AAA family ATPase [Streptomyces sp. DSM 40473]MDT0447744.1 AAA family ATPase [Streptomyces sp. DSM 40473]
MPLVDPLLAHYGRARGRLTSALTRLERGGSAVVVVTGPPGHGRHALLRWAADAAERRGLQVLTARATPAATTVPHALTGALLESRTTTADGRDEPLQALADGPGELLAAAVRARPTLVVVEDVHRADPDSARLLAALADRPRGPVVLLMSTYGTPPRLSAALARMGGGATELVLPAVDERGAAAMAAAVCGGTPADDRFARAAAEATGGNPAILEDALRRLAQRGHPPVAAHIPRIRELAAEAAADHVVRVLRTLRPDERTALRALAASGGVLDLPALRRLTGTRPEDEPALWAALEATGLVTPGRPLPGIDPATATRVLADMPAGERAALYERAAELAHRAGTAGEDLAGLLLDTPPTGRDWVVPALRHAHAAAVRREDHAHAAACLRRALAEPLAPAERARLELELAATEALTAPEAADRRLGALARDPDPALAAWRVRAVDHGLLRGYTHGVGHALADALARAEGAEHDDLVALHWAAHHGWREETDPGTPRIPRLPRVPRTPAQAGVRAWQLARDGEDLAGTLRLAREALVPPAGRDTLLLPRLAACRALYLADDYETADAGIAALLADVRRDRLRAGVARVLTVRAEMSLRRGLLSDAERYVAEAERSLPPGGWHPATAPYLSAVRTAVALENGDRDTARACAFVPAPAGAEDSAPWAYLLFARALVAVADDDLPEAMGLFRETGRILLRRQYVNPALLPWRSLAARTALALGEHAEARRLSAQELALARRWGAAGTIGWAELNAALPTGEQRPAKVCRAVDVLRDTPAGLAHAWALADLAALELRTGNEPPAAAPWASDLSALITAHPSSRLADTVRRLAGDRGPAPSPTDVRRLREWATLSQAETHTATLAGQGHANRAIAELLSVSRRTVELRLSSVYKKLGVSGRGELRALVRGMESN